MNMQQQEQALCGVLIVAGIALGLYFKEPLWGLVSPTGIMGLVASGYKARAERAEAANRAAQAQPGS